MPQLSRAQLLVYGAIAVALLLLGARWLRAADEGGAATGVQFGASAGEAAPSGGLSIEGGGDAVVHVAGEVREPGVYRLPSGARVADAVRRAGGATAAGSADAINLAAPVADGQQVVVPASAGTGAAPGASGAAEGPISLGSATAEDLDTIEGIGPVTAAGIIEFRDQQGGVASVEDLDQISGIGPATMDALRARLQP